MLHLRGTKAPSSPICNQAHQNRTFRGTARMRRTDEVKFVAKLIAEGSREDGLTASACTCIQAATHTCPRQCGQGGASRVKAEGERQTNTVDETASRGRTQGRHLQAVRNTKHAHTNVFVDSKSSTAANPIMPCRHARTTSQALYHLLSSAQASIHIQASRQAAARSQTIARCGGVQSPRTLLKVTNIRTLQTTREAKHSNLAATVWS